ncbi:MAG: DUF1800 family protein [Alphaproteobacteria bacterium]|nr:DUF1800 family protein [Alphaproteobacteria bacterium]
MMAALAVTRFGLGARPGDIAAASGDPRGALLDQIDPRGADQPQAQPETAAERFIAMRAYQELRRAAKDDGDPKTVAVQQANRVLREKAAADFLARARLGAGTPAGFRERWALFWANHFTVSSTKEITGVMVGPFEQEVIRPYAFNSFENLLVASSTHPAMLTYLDQAQSVGPGSKAAGRNGQRGLNENLAREILELHTVGIEAGYSQADVTEFARALTGFSVGKETDDRAGQFVFRDNIHEPGARVILGKTYKSGDLDQGLAVLKALAAHPATARHLSFKIARHFVADDPPPALVARLEARWIKSGGRLDQVARELVAAPEAWDPAATKFKTPYEFLISSWRLIGAQPSAYERITVPLIGLAQRGFSAPSPKGWSDMAGEWCSPDGLIKRLQWSQAFAAVVAGRLDPNQVATDGLGARLTPPTAQAVARAETRGEAVALLLMSPEFQRR